MRDLSIADFISMVKSLGVTPAAPPLRHLQALPSAHDMRELLSDRELEVVRLVAEGLSNKEISIRLELSDKTVKNHISHILAKMQLTARTQVAVHALRAGLVWLLHVAVHPMVRREVRGDARAGRLGEGPRHDRN